MFILAAFSAMPGSKIMESPQGPTYTGLGDRDFLDATDLCPLFEIIEGPDDDIGFGIGVSDLGDTDGDGTDDIVIMRGGSWGGGHHGHYSMYYHYGPKNHILSGSKDRDLDTRLRTIGDVSWSTFLGDVNGDGYHDMASMAYPCNYTNLNWYVTGQPISLQIMYGGSAGLLLKENSKLDIHPIHTNATDWDLISYAGVGDVNGDGYDDLLVVATKIKQSIAPLYTPQEVQLYYGSREGLRGEPGWSALVPPELSHHWYTILSIDHGDFNNDGHSDVVIGRKFISDAIIPYEGRALFISIFYGSSNGLDLEPDFSYSKDEKGSDVLNGHILCELNGDGYTDLLTVCRERSNRNDTRYLETFLGSAAGLGDEPLDVLNVGAWEKTPNLMADIDGDGLDDIVHVSSKEVWPDVWPAVVGFQPPCRLDITVDVYHNNGNSFDASPGFGGKLLSILGRQVTGLEVSDMDGDGMDDIVLGIRGTTSRGSANQDWIYHPGHVVVVFGAGLMQANQVLEIGGGPRLYAGYKDYHFIVRDLPAADEPSTVICMTLDPDHANVTFSWHKREGLGDWFERSDNEYTRMSSLFDDVTYDPDTGRASIDFKVFFKWNWPHEEPCDVVMEYIDPDGLTRVIRKYSVFSVENDLDFHGTPELEGEWQGALEEDDWVRGGETISVKGLELVYEGTTDIHPPEGVCNVVLIDNDEDFGSQPNGPDGIVDVSIKADDHTDADETLLLTLQDLPGTAKTVRHITFDIRVDATPPEFKNPMPDGDEWITTPRVHVAITADDTGTSGVNASTLEYSYSVRGTVGYGLWLRTNLVTLPDGPMVDAFTYLDLPNGDSYYLRWRVKDLVGNGYTVSRDFRIRVDTQNVSFTDPVPPDSQWLNSTAVMAGVTIRDLMGSGIDVSTIEYRVSHDNITHYGEWRHWTGQLTDSQTVNARVEVLMGEGPFNYIQWRAADIAGNGLSISPHFRVQVDTTEITFHGFEPADIQTTSEVNASVVVDDGALGSGFVFTEIYYRLRVGTGEFSQWELAHITLIMVGTHTGPFPVIEYDSKRCIAWIVLMRLAEGSVNKVQFKAIDQVLNGPTVSLEYTITVDTHGPEFLEISPAEGEVQRDPEVLVLLLIDDAIAGVDATEVWYRSGMAGEDSLGNWSRMPVENVEDGWRGMVVVDLARGRTNVVQFKCMDKVGNVGTSEVRGVWVNRLPTAIVRSPRTGEEYPHLPKVRLDAGGSVDPDGDSLTYEWYVDGSSTPSVVGEVGELLLQPGSHNITMVVRDEYGGEDSVTVQIGIYIEEQKTFSSMTSLVLLLVIIVTVITALYVRRKHASQSCEWIVVSESEVGSGKSPR